MQLMHKLDNFEFENKTKLVGLANFRTYTRLYKLLKHSCANDAVIMCLN